MDTNIEDRYTQNPLKRNLKDSVFSDLFSEEWYASNLARELVPEIPDGTPVKVSNAGSVMSPGPIHDLVLIAGDYAIVAVEAQSTKNPNMPMRILLYEFDILAPMLHGLRRELLSGAHAKMPMVLAFVIYTGSGEVPEVMRLSDCYPDRPPADTGMELTVKVIHASNAPKGSKVSEYIRLCQLADGCRKEAKGDMELYARLLKERSEKANILQEYLREKWVEVMGYYEAIFNQDVADEAMRMDAEREGREKVAVKLLADGMAPEKVSELTDLDMDCIRKLMESRPAVSQITTRMGAG